VGRNPVGRKGLSIADEVDSPSAVGQRECMIAHAGAPSDVPHNDNSGAPRSVPGATSGDEAKHRADHQAKERPYEDDLFGKAMVRPRLPRDAGAQKRKEKVHRVRWLDERWHRMGERETRWGFAEEEEEEVGKVTFTTPIKSLATRSCKNTPPAREKIQIIVPTAIATAVVAQINLQAPVLSPPHRLSEVGLLYILKGDGRGRTGSVVHHQRSFVNRTCLRRHLIHDRDRRQGMSWFKAAGNYASGAIKAAATAVAPQTQRSPRELLKDHVAYVRSFYDATQQDSSAKDWDKLALTYRSASDAACSPNLHCHAHLKAEC